MMELQPAGQNNSNLESKTMNLARLVFDSAERFPDKVALLTSNHSQCLTYAELAEKIKRLAKGFESLGVTSGTRVALLLYNEISFVLAYFALLGLGATVLPLNTRLTADELSVILIDSETDWLLSHQEFEPVFSALQVPSLKGKILDGLAEGHKLELGIRSFESLFNESGFAESGEPSQPFPCPVARNIATNPDPLAVLIYTSGTTGQPKGVMLTHKSLLADATANRQVIEAETSDRFITISPLFHVFGQVNILLTAMLVGGSLVLVKKFSPKAVLEAIESHQVTFMAAVPTMYQMMLSLLEGQNNPLPEGCLSRFPSLRICHSGAAPMAKEVFHRVEAAFGAKVQEGYGLSEASSIVTSNPLRGVRKPGSVGLAIPGVTVQVMDETMTPLPPGEIGELHVQGDILMAGYYRRPEETAKVLVNGWLKTKDMAYLDEDGYVFIVDRKDDLMNIGGVKVYPREVEEVLYKHPDVHAVAVISVSSALYHEEIKAFVVLKASDSQESLNKTGLTKNDLQKFCRDHLAEYKVPKHIEFVDEIPQGATGKILRKVLRTS